MATPDMLTPAEVGILMRRSRDTVWRYVAAGKLPAVRIGGSRLLIPRAAVEMLLGSAMPTEAADDGAADAPKAMTRAALIAAHSTTNWGRS